MRNWKPLSAACVNFHTHKIDDCAHSEQNIKPDDAVKFKAVIHFTYFNLTPLNRKCADLDTVYGL
jgi:hypothetical protein